MVKLRQNIQLMFSEDDISQRVKEMGSCIRNDYEGKDLAVIGLLKGVYPFIADLTRAIDLDFQVGFMTVSSYGAGQESSGDVKIIQDINFPIKGKSVLIIEDIVDTGQTLFKVINHLHSRLPSSIKICTLLDKPCRRIADVQADYVGFTIEDLFVVGYGMDANELYRNLPYIGVYNPV